MDESTLRKIIREELERKEKNEKKNPLSTAIMAMILGFCLLGFLTFCYLLGKTF